MDLEAKYQELNQRPKAPDLCCNFDGVVNQETAELLKKGKHAAAYPGWEFFAVCWWEDNQYHALIKRYNVAQEVISADTPEELREAVCEKYGYQ